MGDYHHVVANWPVGHFLVPNGLWVELLKTEKPQGLKTLLCIQRDKVQSSAISG